MPETAAPPTNALATVIQQAGLATTTEAELIKAFIPLANIAADLIERSKAIVVTDATQLDEMARARENRLALKAVRTHAEKARKEFKEDFLKGGRAIDSVAKYLFEKIEPAEARMLAAEEFALRAQQARQEALRIERAKLLRPFGVDVSELNLGTMAQGTFDSLLAGARGEAQRKADEEAAHRVAQEEAEKQRLADEEQLRADNLRLQQEQESERAAARIEQQRLNAERERAETALRAQRDADALRTRQERERHEEELAKERAKTAQAQAAAKAAQLAAEKKAAEERKAKRVAAAAPDRVKLILLADKIAATAAEMPDMATDEGKANTAWIRERLEHVESALRGRINEMAAE